MRALILGASGQVGQALIRECESRGWEWTGSHLDHPQGAEARTFRLDLSDLDGVRAAVEGSRADVVFLPSGWTWVDGCETDENRAVRVNALAPEAAARACAGNSARLVYYSTDYVFGEQGGPHTEDDRPEPLGAYGRSKLEGERRVTQVLPQALILRTTVVYGPEPQGKNFIYQLARALTSGKGMTLPEDQLSTATYNRDLARASVELVEAGESGLWNVSGPENIGRADFGRLAAEVFGLDAGLIRGETTAKLAQKARRPLTGGLEGTKLRVRLGWEMASPRRGLERMRSELDAAGRWEAFLGRQ
jgi:dTDP-4-dehydrorhamnose reductase